MRNPTVLLDPKARRWDELQGDKERCGLLLGKRKKHIFFVTGLTEVPNRSRHPDRFSIWEEDVAGHRPVGVWHTHPLPHHDPGPSDYDVEAMCAQPDWLGLVINSRYRSLTWFDWTGWEQTWAMK